MSRYPWLWVVAGFLLAGCAESIPHPGEMQLRWAETHGFMGGLDSLKEGRRLYVMKCDGCHRLYRPSKYPPDVWPKWIDSMQVEFVKVKTELPTVEANAIRHYLAAASGHWQDSLAALKGFP